MLLTYGSTWLTLIMSRDPHGSATIGSHRSRLLMEPVPGETPLRLKRSDGRDARGTTPPMVVVAEVQAVGAVVPGLSQPLRIFEPVPDDRWSLQPAARRAEPATMNQDASASEPRRLDKGQTVPAVCKQVAFATNSNSLGISGVVTYCGWVAA